MPKFPCEVCGKERQFNPAQLPRIKHHFCSRDCYATWRRGRFTGADHWNYASEEKSCVVCGAVVIRQMNKRQTRPRSVCSRACWRELRSRQMSDENHPNWKGGRELYYGPDWKAAKAAVRERDQNTCRDCGRVAQPGDRRFDVHHVVARRDGGTNDLPNLVLLCVSCHLKQEWADQKRRGEPPRGPIAHVEPGPQERISQTAKTRRLRPVAGS